MNESKDKSIKEILSTFPKDLQGMKRILDSMLEEFGSYLECSFDSSFRKAGESELYNIHTMSDASSRMYFIFNRMLSSLPNEEREFYFMRLQVFDYLRRNFEVSEYERRFMKRDVDK